VNKQELLSGVLTIVHLLLLIGYQQTAPLQLHAWVMHAKMTFDAMSEMMLQVLSNLQLSFAISLPFSTDTPNGKIKQQSLALIQLPWVN